MRFFLIDGQTVFSNIHLMLSNDGVEISPTVFFDRCLKYVNNSIKDIDPSHVAFCMDDFSRLEKRAIYPGYKASSFKLPTDYYGHLPLFIRKLKEIGVKSITVSSYESCDIISTFVSKAKGRFKDIMFYILGADKRLYSLLDTNVFLYNKSKPTYDLESFKKNTSFPPALWPDILSLIGYKSKSIEGIAGIGIKRAESLLSQYGSVRGMIENKSSIEGSYGDEFRRLTSNDNLLSLELATLHNNISIGVPLADIQYHLN